MQMSENESYDITGCFPELPYYLKIIRRIENNSVFVDIHSQVHVNKIVTMGLSWSVDFVASKHKEFRRDVLNFVISRYGLRKNEEKYS